MLDFLYKLLRARMSAKLYQRIQMGPFGRARKWYAPETYKRIMNIYTERNYNFRDQIILEVGCGNQLYTALSFIACGAKKVILVDPKLKISQSMIDDNIRIWNSSNIYAKIAHNNIDKSILGFSDLSDIPSKYDRCVDNVFSHLVLEHFMDLPSYFCNIRRLLTADGISDNLVDLSDHSYHVFHEYLPEKVRRKVSLLHLGYSDRIFSVINDDRIFMNRMLMPVYTDLAKSNTLNAKVISIVPSGKAKIHNDVLSKFHSRNPNDIFVLSFRILLSKSAL